MGPASPLPRESQLQRRRTRGPPVPESCSSTPVPSARGLAAPRPRAKAPGPEPRPLRGAGEAGCAGRRTDVLSVSPSLRFKQGAVACSACRPPDFLQGAEQRRPRERRPEMAVPKGGGEAWGHPAAWAPSLAKEHVPRTGLHSGGPGTLQAALATWSGVQGRPGVLPSCVQAKRPQPKSRSTLSEPLCQAVARGRAKERASPAA